MIARIAALQGHFAISFALEMRRGFSVAQPS
jgi:hypothetical protein